MLVVTLNTQSESLQFNQYYPQYSHTISPVQWKFVKVYDWNSCMVDLETAARSGTRVRKRNHPTDCARPASAAPIPC